MWRLRAVALAVGLGQRGQLGVVDCCWSCASEQSADARDDGAASAMSYSLLFISYCMSSLTAIPASPPACRRNAALTQNLGRDNVERW